MRMIIKNNLCWHNASHPWIWKTFTNINELLSLLPWNIVIPALQGANKGTVRNLRTQSWEKSWWLCWELDWPFSGLLKATQRMSDSFGNRTQSHRTALFLSNPQLSSGLSLLFCLDEVPEVESVRQLIYSISNLSRKLGSGLVWGRNFSKTQFLKRYLSS